MHNLKSIFLIFWVPFILLFMSGYLPLSYQKYRLNVRKNNIAKNPSIIFLSLISNYFHGMYLVWVIFYLESGKNKVREREGYRR